jgi:mono/diheme cytochrome c family protein
VAMKLSLVLLVAACGSPAPELPTADNALPIVYPIVAHSGFDGVAMFQVPLVTNLIGDVSWSIDDAAIAELRPAPAPAGSTIEQAAWAVAITHKAGASRIVARVGEDVAEAMLEVTAYAPAAVAAGRARYTATTDPTGPRRGCASCHALPQGADHSPTLMAYYPDDAILAAITTGKYPDGRELTLPDHMWQLDDAERAGIVAYLRTLPPRGF